MKFYKSQNHDKVSKLELFDNGTILYKLIIMCFKHKITTDKLHLLRMY